MLEFDLVVAPRSRGRGTLKDDETGPVIQGATLLPLLSSTCSASETPLLVAVKQSEGVFAKEFLILRPSIAKASPSETPLGACKLTKSPVAVSRAERRASAQRRKKVLEHLDSCDNAAVIASLRASLAGSHYLLSSCAPNETPAGLHPSAAAKVHPDSIPECAEEVEAPGAGGSAANSIASKDSGESNTERSSCHDGGAGLEAPQGPAVGTGLQAPQGPVAMDWVAAKNVGSAYWSRRRWRAMMASTWHRSSSTGPEAREKGQPEGGKGGELGRKGVEEGAKGGKGKHEVGRNSSKEQTGGGHGTEAKGLGQCPITAGASQMEAKVRSYVVANRKERALRGKCAEEGPSAPKLVGKPTLAVKFSPVDLVKPQSSPSLASQKRPSCPASPSTLRSMSPLPFVREGPAEHACSPLTSSPPFDHCSESGSLSGPLSPSSRSDEDEAASTSLSGPLPRRAPTGNAAEDGTSHARGRFSAPLSPSGSCKPDSSNGSVPELLHLAGKKLKEAARSGQAGPTVDAAVVKKGSAGDGGVFSPIRSFRTMHQRSTSAFPTKAAPGLPASRRATSPPHAQEPPRSHPWLMQGMFLEPRLAPAASSLITPAASKPSDLASGMTLMCKSCSCDAHSKQLLVVTDTTTSRTVLELQGDLFPLYGPITRPVSLAMKVDLSRISLVQAFALGLARADSAIAGYQ